MSWLVSAALFAAAIIALLMRRIGRDAGGRADTRYFQRVGWVFSAGLLLLAVGLLAGLPPRHPFILMVGMGSAYLQGTAEPGGSFGPWSTAPLDLTRGDMADLAWYPAGGTDEWHLSQASRTLIVEAGQAQVSGSAPAGSAVVVTLRSPAGVVRRRLVTRASRNAGVRNTFTGTLRRKGAP